MRVATYNAENVGPTVTPERRSVLQSALTRINADVLCLQEINSAEAQQGATTLTPLDLVLEGTRYESYNRAFTQRQDGSPLSLQNIVVISSFPVLEQRQYLNTLTAAPLYRPVTEVPRPVEATEVRPDRPVLHVILEVGGRRLHVLCVHLKARIPVAIDGQLDRIQNDKVWRSVSGWAEGTLLSSLRRVAQALEVRIAVDKVFDAEPDALIIVCGDFNADIDEIPVAAIRGEVEETHNSGLLSRVMLPCERTVPESSRFSLYHHGRGRMLDHVLMSRAMLTYYRGTEIHNESLQDKSVSFASNVNFPESDHAPIIAEFEFDAFGWR